MKGGIAKLFLMMIFLLPSCSFLQSVDAKPKPKHRVGFMPQSYSLNGEWDFYPGFQDMQDIKDVPWGKIKVPSNWYLSGHDIDSAWYRKIFYVPDEFSGSKIGLQFSGVDYIADVWLNGIYLGRHEGYFQSFYLPVSKVNFYMQNELLVRVLSPLERPENYSLNKKLIKGIFSHHDTRPGNAWSPLGQEKNTGGIWSDVEIRISKGVHLLDIPVKIRKIKSNIWKLSAKVNYEGDMPKGSHLYWQITSNGRDERIWFKKSKISKTGKNISIEIKNPDLWWPVNYGKQNMYQLKIQLINNSDVLDQKKIDIGIRDISIDDKQVWSINDKRILLKGTNYIATQWLSEMSEKNYREDIQLMLDAHVNVVRVHAHIADKVFYELCDEMGMMVWQDYPLQWGYSDDAGTHASALNQLDDMFEQFYNHPSIIQWSLHNEPPWDSPWMKQKYANYNPDQNRLLDKKLYERALEKEEDRPVHMLSSGQEHPWLGWYSGSWLDYTKPAKTAWVSEFGAQALPIRETVEAIFPESMLWPDTEEEWQLWDYHNFQKRETFEIAKIDKGENLDQFIENTQTYQSNLIQLAGESYRRQAYQPVAAIFQFMFVENWPSINWGIVDYLRRPKPGYYALKRAYQPVLPSLEWNAVIYKKGQRPNVGVWAVNDSLVNYHGATYIVSLRYKGDIIDQRKWEIDINSDSRNLFSRYSPPVGLDVGDYTLVATIQDSKRRQLGKTEYKFTVKESD